MSNTYMPLYGVYDVATGNLQGVCPVTGVVSQVGGNPVSITGTAAVGQVLTATLATGWTATGYQWTRDGTNISGQTLANYTVVSGDSGHTVGVNVTGLLYAAIGAAISSGAAVAPVITTAPVLAANVAGAAVNWTPGTVTGNPTPTVTFDLKKNGSVVSSGATSGSYSAGTAGDIFIVTQKATNSAGTATPVDSNAVTVTSSGSAPVTATAPVVVSTAVVGVPMAFVPGTYTGTVTSRTIQWNKNGTAISGATSATYTPVTGDAQALLTVTETAVNSFGNSGSNVSGSQVVAPASAAYATALSGATEGNYFTAPDTPGYRYRIYKKTGGVGVYYDTTPVSGAANSVAASMAVLAPMAVTPLVDFDSIDLLYGETQMQSRISGAPTRTFNLLGGISYATTQYLPQNAPTINPRVADPWGGTSALEFNCVSGAAASSDIYFPVRIPPGTWTLSFWARTTGQGATQNIKFGYNGTTTILTAGLTTTWQQFSQTFNVTAEATFNAFFVQGDYPSVASVAYQFALSGLSMIPGATALSGQPDTHAHPTLATTANVNMTGYLATATAAGAMNGNALIAKQTTLSNITAFTWMHTLNAPLHATNSTIGSMGSPTAPAAQYALSMPVTGLVAQTTKVSGQTYPGITWAGYGLITHTIVVTSTTVSTYLNGVLMDVQAISGVGSVTNLALVMINAYGSAGGFTLNSPYIGDTAGCQMWGTALTDAQVAAAHVVAANRLTAKGLTLQVHKNLVIGNGDSIGFGLLDTTNAGGFFARATIQDASATARAVRIPFAQHCITGEHWSQLLVSEAPFTFDQIARCVAASIRPIVMIEIGTNDDASLTTQSACDSYYSNGSGFAYTGPAGTVTGSGGLKEYAALLRSKGAKVVLCTTIPDGRTAPSAVGFDSTATGTISTGPLAGNSYPSWRMYLNARIAATAGTDYDTLCDLAGTGQFNANSYALSGGGTPSTIYGDTLHPNPAGNVILEVPAATAITSLLAP